MSGGIMYDQKSIVLIPFPYSDLTGSKLRPALIISNSLVNNTSDRICCLITSQAPDEGIEIIASMYKKGKLPFQSWIKPYRLFTINEKIVVKELCGINDLCFEMVLTKLNRYIKKE